jgi:hypothetical protein
MQTALIIPTIYDFIRLNAISHTIAIKYATTAKLNNIAIPIGHK